MRFSNKVQKVTAGSGDLRKGSAVHETVLSNRIGNLAEHAKVDANGTFELIEFDPKVFNFYLQHRYTQHLPSKSDASNVGLDDYVHDLGLL